MSKKYKILYKDDGSLHKEMANINNQKERVMDKIRTNSEYARGIKILSNKYQRLINVVEKYCKNPVKLNEEKNLEYLNLKKDIRKNSSKYEINPYIPFRKDLASIEIEDIRKNLNMSLEEYFNNEIFPKMNTTRSELLLLTRVDVGKSKETPDDIDKIEIHRLEKINDNYVYKIFINGRYESPIEVNRGKNWDLFYEIAKSNFIPKNKKLKDYMNSNKNNPIYRRTKYKTTKILKDELENTVQNIKIKILKGPQIKKLIKN